MKPTLSVQPGGYLLDWENPPITVECKRLRQHRDGRFTAYIKIVARGEVSPGHLHGADFNLASTAARITLAKALTERYEADWYALLEQLCHYVREAFEQGELVQEIWSNEEPGPLKYLVRPLMPLGQPTIVYGDGGALKSTIAQLIALVALLPWEDNPLGLIPPGGVTPSLYLDWETDEDEFRWRLNAIGRGMELPPTALLYRRMSLPLVDDIEAIAGLITKHNTRLLIVDSLGAAAGGDLNATEPCLRLYAALRQTRCTSLLLAHNAKDLLTKRRTVYGNVHYMNYARSVWEARKVQEEGSQKASLALFHRKQNRQFFPPLGFLFTFGENSLGVTRQDVGDMAALRDQLTVGQQILTELRSGALSKTSLDDSLDPVRPTVISSTLGRLKKEGKVVLLPGGIWGLAAPSDI